MRKLLTPFLFLIILNITKVSTYHTTYDSNVCSLQNTITEVIFYQHEFNCWQFYKCDNGKEVLQNCPSGLHYNPNKRECDWPENVKCQEENSTKGSNDYNISQNNNEFNESENKLCPQEDLIDDILYPHETSCSQFYKCNRGNKVLQNCPTGLLYNSEIKQCDWPRNVNCKDGNHKTNNRYEVLINNNEVPVCFAEYSGQNVLYPHESNCSQFYKCSYGQKIIQNCPYGLNYNAKLQQCDWADNVNCSNNNGNDKNINNKNNNSNDNNNENESNGNSNSNTIDNNNGHNANNKRTGTKTQVCPDVDSGEETLYPHKLNCTQLYKCNNGQKVLQSCPTGLLYNANINHCDWPENVKCSNHNENNNNIGNNSNEKRIDENSNSGNSNGNNNINSQNDTTKQPCNDDYSGIETLYPHETNCAQFYKCNYGQKMLQNCPTGLLYNSNIKQCDWPEKVTCSNHNGSNNNIGSNINGNENNNIESNSNENGNNQNSNTGNMGNGNGSNNINSETGTTNQVCPDDYTGIDTLYPHESNCAQFYKCSYGQKVLQNCPTGLLYNSNLKQCDWPEIVKCSNHNGSNSNIGSNNNGNGNNNIGSNSNNNGNGNNQNSNTGNLGNGNINNNINSETGTTNQVCPDDYTGIDTLYPHESNCAQFYKCSYGQKVLQNCPTGLLYNSNIKQCDWPEKVKCSNHNGSNNNIGSNSNGNGNNNIDSNSNGNGNNQNSNTGNMGNGNGSNNINSETGTTNQVCPDDYTGIDTLYPHESNCAQFYKCSYGQKVLQNCPTGLLYNSNIKQCDWPEKVKCSNHNGSNSNIGSNNNGNGNNNIDSNSNGNGNNQNSNTGNMGNGNGSNNINSETGTTNQVCPDDYTGIDTLYPHESNCAQFYKCSYGQKVLQNCPTGLLYNSNIKQCDWPEKVKCSNHNGSNNNIGSNSNGNGNNNIDSNSNGNGNNQNSNTGNMGNGNGSNNINSETGTTNQVCPDDYTGIDTLYPHESNCAQFYKCSYGQKVLQNCPTGLLYNSNIKQCDWPEKVKCSNHNGSNSNIGSNNNGNGNNNIESNSNENGNNQNSNTGNMGNGNGSNNINSETGTTNQVCPDDYTGIDTLYPHESNCAQFYKCSYGQKVLQNCPTGLLYNSNLKQCDWPEIVKCSNHNGSNSNIGSNNNGNGNNNIDSNSNGNGNNQNSNTGNMGNGNGSNNINSETGTTNQVCPDDYTGIDTLYPHESNCAQFYKCSYGQKVLQNCPTGLLYNSNIKQCDWPEKVKCSNHNGSNNNIGSNSNGNGNNNIDSNSNGNGNNQNSNTGNMGNGNGSNNINSETGTTNQVCPDDYTGIDTLYPHESNCAQFYKCSYGQKVLQNCPTGLLYNSNIKQCDWPEKVKCSNHNGSNSNIGSNNNGNGNNNIDSNSNGNGNNQNSNTGNMGNGNGSNNINSETGTTNQVCPDDYTGIDTLYPHESNCAQFYKCSYGQKVLQNCPTGLLYNSNIKQCDWPEKVKCSNHNGSNNNIGSNSNGNGNNNIDSNSNGNGNNQNSNTGNMGNGNGSNNINSETGTTNQVCPDDYTGIDTLYPHESNCAQFYKCSYGQKVLQNCPTGLLYNSNIKQCDWPEKVKCSNHNGSNSNIGSNNNGNGNNNIESNSNENGNNQNSNTGNMGNGNGSNNINSETGTTNQVCPDEYTGIDTLYPHESNCAQFYKCSYGQKVLQNCPTGLLYNSNLKQCDWPEIVKCSNHNGSNSNIGSNNNGNGNNNIGSNSNGNGNNQNSNTGNMGIGNGNININSETGTTNQVCPDDYTGIDTLYPHESNCAQFYKCSYGQKVLQNCPTGLLYNSNLKQCDWPEIVKCSNHNGSNSNIGSNNNGNGNNNIGSNSNNNGNGNNQNSNTGNMGNGNGSNNINSETGTTNQVCPNDYTGIDTLYPHESNCAQFYKCSYGQKVLQNCPTGLLYNSNIKQCDWPEKVKCSNHNGSNNNIGSNSNGNGNNNIDSNSNGNGNNQNSNTVNMGNGNINNNINSETGTTNQVCPDDYTGIDTLYPHESNCAQFYKCSYGQKVLQNCPTGLLYNSNLKQCDWPEIVKCSNHNGSNSNIGSNNNANGNNNIGSNSNNNGNGNNQNSNTVNMGNGNGSNNINSETGTTNQVCPDDYTGIDTLYPHESNCAQFYKCSYGQKVLQNCPTGLLYNSNLKQCDWPEIVKCSNHNGSNSNIGSNNNGNGNNNIGSNNNGNGNNQNSNTVNMGNGNINNNINSETGTTNQVCPDDYTGIDTLYPHESNCAQFYKCSYGQKVLQNCPTGLLYNSNLKQCDWPEKVKCSNHNGSNNNIGSNSNGNGNNNIDSNSNGNGNNQNSNTGNMGNGNGSNNINSETGTTNQVCPDDYTGIDTLYPHESNCAQFYKCSYGQKVLQNCPTGLLYNSNIKQCDWPEKVKCSNHNGSNSNIGSNNNGNGNNNIDSNSNGNGNNQNSNTGNMGNGNGSNNINSETGTTNQVCPDDYTGIDTLYPHESNCAQFYKCSYGQKVLQNCPTGLLYNSNIKQCDWPEKVKCSNHNGSNNNIGSNSNGNGNNNIDSNSNGNGNNQNSNTGNMGNGNGSNNINSETGTTNQVCPDDYTGIDTLYPHESNCAQFYKCSYGQKVLQNCPTGLLYNSNIKQCDWPEKVKCSNHNGSNSNIGSNNNGNGNNNIGNNSNNNGNGNNQNSNTGNMGNGNGSNNINSETGTTNQVCPDDYTGIDTLYPHESNCAQFYKCSYGQKVLQNCPTGLLYNSNLKQCDWPRNVRCSSIAANNNSNANVNSYKEQKKTNYNVSGDSHVNNNGTEIKDDNGKIESVTRICPSVDSDDDVLYPHESNCSQFYKCSYGHKVVQNCPPGLHYNSNVKQCDWPENFNCSSNNGSSNGDTNSENNGPDAGTQICPADDFGGDIFYPHESNCSKFYECSQGQKVEQSCPSGLHYNANIKQCDWPADVNCDLSDSTISKNNVILDDKGNNNQSKNGKCPTDDPSAIILISHETDCALFYKCANGEKVVQRCPDQLLYNPRISQCDWPKNVNCNSSSNTSENNDKDHGDIRNNNNQIGKDVCPIDNSTVLILLPHETNCTLFYICHNEHKVLFVCPDGLHYNPATFQCDWPKNVGCNHV